MKFIRKIIKRDRIWLINFNFELKEGYSSYVLLEVSLKNIKMGKKILL